MIKQAHLEWSNGTPVSTEFQDVYFNKANGAKETEYVFLEGNNLEARWSDDSFKQDHFTIAETGFGTGLNFYVLGIYGLNTVNQISTFILCLWRNSH